MSKTRTPLRDIISNDVVCVHPKDSLRRAMAVMLENRVAALPVVDELRHCIGIISATDLLSMTKDLSDELNALSHLGRLNHAILVEKLQQADLFADRVQDWMSSDVISVGIDSTIEHAAKEMLRNQIHRLVVLDDKHFVVGIVSTMDLLAVFTDGQSLYAKNH